MRKLPAVSEMEHITSKEFGENMDAILERVAKENIALIIDHDDKSYVLCPARWFDVPELTQLEVIVMGKISDGCGGVWCEMKQALEDALMKANKEDTTETQ